MQLLLKIGLKLVSECMVARDSDRRLIETKVLTKSECISPVFAEAIAVKEGLIKLD